MDSATSSGVIFKNLCQQNFMNSTLISFIELFQNPNKLLTLNFLQRLSGIATRARAFVDPPAGRIAILDTRKTTPTLRALERYAVAVGGATNHRTGLFDAGLV